jgi:hypothetical protein
MESKNINKRNLWIKWDREFDLNEKNPYRIYFLVLTW